MTTIKPPVPTPPSGAKQTVKQGGNIDVAKDVPKKPVPPKDGGKDGGDLSDDLRTASKKHAKHVSIPAQAAGLLGRFDTNGDGGIDVAREAVKFEGNRTFGHSVSVETMARAADLRGNHNGSANGVEIQALMLTYDVGSDQTGIRAALDPAVAGDGTLSGSEYRNFMEDFGPVDGPSFRPFDAIRDVPNRYPDVGGR